MNTSEYIWQMMLLVTSISGSDRIITFPADNTVRIASEKILMEMGMCHLLKWH